MARTNPIPDIVQITPATGWLWVYRDMHTGDVLTAPVALWALVRHTDGNDTWQQAEGLEAAESQGLVRCEEATNFLGYAPADTFNADRWKDAQP